MQVFCNDSIVLATHADGQVIPAGAYPGLDRIVVPDDYVFERVGPEPQEGWPDDRPLARPVLTPEQVRAALPSISPRQLRLMLLVLGMTEADITGPIEAIEDPGERAAAMIEWQWATSYDRQHPLLLQIAGALEFNPGEFDDLWAYAASL